jgi:hypothetical protein
MEDTQALPAPPKSTVPVFDRNNPLTLNLRRAGKSITVRFPSDEELAKRERRMRTFYKKGSSLPEFDGLEEANFELAQSIRTGGDEVDEASAGRIVDIVLRAVPEQPERTSDGYRIPLSVVLNIQTAHTLREPTEKEIRKYRESAIWMGDLRFGRQEAKTMLSAVGSFYDKLHVAAEGYAGGKETIPVTHKSLAVNALLTQIKEEQEADEVDPAGF